jgi:hypothetical protein
MVEAMNWAEAANVASQHGVSLGAMAQNPNLAQSNLGDAFVPTKPSVNARAFAIALALFTVTVVVFFVLTTL